MVSPDKRLDLELSRPREMGGDGGPGTNPEQLFAAGYAACFHSAMRYAVKDLGPPADALEATHVSARVHFLKAQRANFGLAVELDFHAPRVEQDGARAVMERTHTKLPVLAGHARNVDVQLRVV